MAQHRYSTVLLDPIPDIYGVDIAANQDDVPILACTSSSNVAERQPAEPEATRIASY